MNENSHSGPTAPTCLRSIHPVIEPNTIAIANMGSREITWRHGTLPLFHQMISSSAAGNDPATVLLSTAAANSTRASTYPPQAGAERSGVPDPSADARKYASIAPK